VPVYSNHLMGNDGRLRQVKRRKQPAMVAVGSEERKASGNTVRFSIGKGKRSTCAPFRPHCISGIVDWADKPFVKGTPSPRRFPSPQGE